MYRVFICCDDPLNQLSRVIDILRRMGADLIAMDVKQSAQDAFDCAIDYAFEDGVRTATFVERLHLVPGVEVQENRSLLHLVGQDRSSGCLASQDTGS